MIRADTLMRLKARLRAKYPSVADMPMRPEEAGRFWVLVAADLLEELEAANRSLAKASEERAAAVAKLEWCAKRFKLLQSPRGADSVNAFLRGLEAEKP